jgi:hypothetical protein
VEEPDGDREHYPSTGCNTDSHRKPEQQIAS